MWGQVSAFSMPSIVARIIPTRVGTSRALSTRKRLRLDHPHACGDKHRYADIATIFPGSSPRVWGQASSTGGAFLARGIIPTRVGTSAGEKRRRLRFWDHPHACGDKNDIFLPICATTDHPHACGDKRQCKDVKGIHEGSSPRVWGQDI